MKINDLVSLNQFAEIKKNIEKESKVNFDELIQDASDSKDTEKLKKVCEDFESIFINMLFKTMRKTVNEGSMVKKSHARKMFEEMLDEEMSNKIASTDSIGIADMLYRNLKEKGGNFDYKG